MPTRSRPQFIDDYIFKVEMGTWYFAPGELETDRHLVDLFRAFKYDIKNPQHWRWLLQELSGPHRHSGRGRPPKWTKAAHGKLLADLYWLGHELRTDPNGLPHLSRKPVVDGSYELAALLKKTHARDPLYKNTSVDEIYKHLLKAQKTSDHEKDPNGRAKGRLGIKRKKRVAKK
ncbi:hypothetical protein [Bradyrhizobium lupini]|uniref:hypothetical protein n=1 Tax=Rhizobium lupini TaxID=136996 RepID=UPI0034C6AF6F